MHSSHSLELKDTHCAFWSVTLNNLAGFLTIYGLTASLKNSWYLVVVVIIRVSATGAIIYPSVCLFPGVSVCVYVHRCCMHSLWGLSFNMYCITHLCLCLCFCFPPAKQQMEWINVQSSANLTASVVSSHTEILHFLFIYCRMFLLCALCECAHRVIFTSYAIVVCVCVRTYVSDLEWQPRAVWAEHSRLQRFQLGGFTTYWLGAI